MGVGMSLVGTSTDASVGLECESDGEGVRAGDDGSSVGGGVGCCARTSVGTWSSIALFEDGAMSTMREE